MKRLILLSVIAVVSVLILAYFIIPLPFGGGHIGSIECYRYNIPSDTLEYKLNRLLKEQPKWTQWYDSLAIAGKSNDNLHCVIQQNGKQIALSLFLVKSQNGPYISLTHAGEKGTNLKYSETISCKERGLYTKLLEDSVLSNIKGADGKQLEYTPF